MSAESPLGNSGHGATAPSLRICIAYDRLYPWSIGGAERWYRRLAEELAREGHLVTYLTTRQWCAGDEPDIAGVQVVSIAPDDALYGRGRRRLIPVLRFGLALWWRLLRRGRDYDVVHAPALSSWSALAAGSLARPRRYRLVLDWWEVWTWAYWRTYLGTGAGAAAWLMQRQTAKLRHEPIAFSTLHARRLESLRRRRDVRTVLGVLATSKPLSVPRQAEPLVVYAGRFVPEKQVPSIVAALAKARDRLPTLRAVLIGEGPDLEAVRQAVRSARLDRAVDLPGFVSEKTLMETLGRAMCLVLLSRREGYGLIVAEAAALGVPSVILRHADSAAADLIVEGVNGFTCASTDPTEVASAILRVYEAGGDLRHATLAWFHTNAGTLSIEGPLSRILDAYRGLPAEENTGA